MGSRDKGDIWARDKDDLELDTPTQEEGVDDITAKVR